MPIYQLHQFLRTLSNDDLVALNQVKLMLIGEEVFWFNFLHSAGSFLSFLFACSTRFRRKIIGLENF